MRALAVVVAGPRRDLGPRIVEFDEQRLVQALVVHAPLQLPTTGLRGAMKRQSIPVSLHQGSMALQAYALRLSETIEPGMSRRATIIVSSNACQIQEHRNWLNDL